MNHQLTDLTIIAYFIELKSHVCKSRVISTGVNTAQVQPLNVYAALRVTFIGLTNKTLLAWHQLSVIILIMWVPSGLCADCIIHVCVMLWGRRSGVFITVPFMFTAARRRISSKSVLLTEAQKQLMVHKLPQVLRLHLKRFRCDSYIVLICKCVHLPLKLTGKH